MTITATDTYGSMADSWAYRGLMQRPLPYCNAGLFGKAFTIPSRNSKTMTARRQNNLPSDPYVLDETRDPAPIGVTKFDVQVTLQEFGQVVSLTELAIDTNEDDMENETIDNLSDSMHIMFDKVIRNVWESGVAVISCLNGDNGEVITNLSETDVSRAISYLDENNSRKCTPEVMGSKDFGTGPIEASFWVDFHVKLKPDVRALENYVPKVTYMKEGGTIESEFGNTDDARWVASTLAKTDGGSPEVFYNTFIGANAYAYTFLDTNSVTMVLDPVCGRGTLNRFRMFGFKARFNACILDDANIVTLLSTKG